MSQLDDYLKEQKKIERYIKAKEKQGYVFDKAWKAKIAKKPKKITPKHIKFLTAQTPAIRKSHIKNYVQISGRISGRTNDIYRAEYMKARKNALQYIRQKEKEGYSFSPEYKEKIEKLPNKPTKKDVEKFKKQSSLKQRKAAMSKAKPPKTKSKPAAVSELPSIVDNVLRNVEELIATWTPPLHWSFEFTEIKRQDKDTLKYIIEGAIARDGRSAVAQRFERYAQAVISASWDICYGQSGKYRDEIQAELMLIVTIANGRTLSKEMQDMVESFNVFSGEVWSESEPDK